MELEQLLYRNYKAVQARGLISPQTLGVEFFDKLQEEVEEVRVEYFENYLPSGINGELSDVATVCDNWLVNRWIARIESLLSVPTMTEDEILRLACHNAAQERIKTAEKNERRANETKC